MDHMFIYVDEAGFSVSKVGRRGPNIVCHRATVTMPGQWADRRALPCGRSVQGGHAPFCNHLGRCGLPQVMNDWFTAHQSMMILFLPASNAKSNRGVFLLLALERIWSQAAGCNECWMLGNLCRGLPGMDSPLQNIFSVMHHNGRHQLWCWREYVA